MKVKELIRQLSQYPPESRVYYGGWKGHGRDEILCTLRYEGSGDVILEDASEFDVGNEVGALLEHYAENNYDETDAYQDMVDKGYTPEVVAYHYSREFADTVMRPYCEEHGIE